MPLGPVKDIIIAIKEFGNKSKNKRRKNKTYKLMTI